MGSAATKYNFDAMENCRQKIATEAGQVGSIGDGFGGVHVDGSICGDLPSSGALINAISKADSTMQTEFHTAEDRLNSLNTAISKIIDVVHTQDADNAAAFNKQAH